MKTRGGRPLVLVVLMPSLHPVRTERCMRFDESTIIRDSSGRFAGRVPAPPAAELLERCEELETTGVVQARSISRRVAGASRTFWRDASATAPINLRNPVPKIDPRPAGTRYKIRTYQGASGGVLRMPSVAGLNRMADSGTASFDVPVQAGNDHGHVAGWVRVTRSERGVWSVRAHGMEPIYAQYAERQVSWVLGSDHPSFAMNEAGTFSQMLAEQERRKGVAPVPVRSATVSELAYDDGSSTLFITPKDKDGQPGSTYAWKAPRDIYERMLVGSAGHIMSTEVVRRRPRVEGEQCPRCGRFWVVTGGRDHDCPALAPPVDAPTGRGDDRALAASLVAASRRGPRQELKEALGDHVVEPPVATFSTIRVDNSRLGGAVRFKNLSGDSATRVIRSLGSQAYQRFPAPAEVLSAAERDERIQVAGRLDHEGVSVEEIIWDSQADTAAEAWDQLKSAHPLPTTDGYDVGRRDRQGHWRFYFASTALRIAQTNDHTR
mgnify:FL=1